MHGLHLDRRSHGCRRRAQLWRATLPAAAPVAESIGFESLARRYAMSGGGYIRYATLRAAFLAAGRGQRDRGGPPGAHCAVEYEGRGKIAA
jgi:hypothetical protein